MEGWPKGPGLRILTLGAIVLALSAGSLAAQSRPPTTVAPRPGTKRTPVPAKRPAPPKPPPPRPKPVTPAVRPAPVPVPKPDASIAFFRDGTVPRLRIEVVGPELEKLRGNVREDVRCTVIEDGRVTYSDVAIHLKGAAGSFRNLDDRPALTLDFDKNREDQLFHDLDKIHLNNSVQDPSYLNELVCGELFLAAGVPAARTSHARVWLNGRDLGFYVLKEGFNKRFLRRHFADPDGNLYEGGFVQDLDGEPRLQSGNGAPDRADVRALLEACRERDTDRRRQRLEQLVDVDRFLSFAALESITSHWDGYCHNRNNYRYYFDPKSGKVQFIPHGMDQMFRQPDFPIEAGGSLVSAALMSIPEFRDRYRRRLGELAAGVAPPDRLVKRVDDLRRRLRPVLEEMGEGPARELDWQARAFQEQIIRRAAVLVARGAVPDPRVMKVVAGGTVVAGGWEPRQETPDAVLERAGTTAAPLLVIRVGPSGRCVASWRATVVLSPGKYRLEARARAEGIQPLKDESGTGAGIRISGGRRTNGLVANAPWTTLGHEFEVIAGNGEVTLVAELRATAGKVSFDPAAIRITRAAAN